MDAASVTVLLATVFLWGVISARVERARLSMPIVFVVAGFLYAEVFHVLEIDVGHESVKLIAEITLVLVLFADASGVDFTEFRSDLAMYVRLLGVACH